MGGVVRQAGAVTIASVVLCAPAPGGSAAAWLDEAEAALVLEGVQVVRPAVPPDDGDDEPARARTAHWVAHTALGVGISGVPAPVMLVACGGASALLPALGFAQRAARRPVGRYLMVGGPAPGPAGGQDWPDAPVTYVLAPDASDEEREAATTARLRGWDVVTGDPLAAVLAAVSPS